MSTAIDIVVSVVTKNGDSVECKGTKWLRIKNLSRSKVLLYGFSPNNCTAELQPGEVDHMPATDDLLYQQNIYIKWESGTTNDPNGCQVMRGVVSASEIVN